MLRTIILLSLLSFVMSEMAADRGKACAYKRETSGNREVQLFVKNATSDEWVLGYCKGEATACRDWWGNGLYKVCKEATDGCKEYKEGKCRGDEWSIDDWSVPQWIIWFIIVLCVVGCSYCGYVSCGCAESKNYSRI